MEQQNSESYDSCVEQLFQMFGDNIPKDVIKNVVSKFGGALEESANVLINMTEENIIFQSNKEQPNFECKSNADSDNVVSYANASKTGAIKKDTFKVVKPFFKDTYNIETKQVKNIFTLHSQGTRTLAILRGPSGSGKSFLAEHIINQIYNGSYEQNHYDHIFSSDNYYMHRGNYKYDRSKLSDAHTWNQNRARKAMIQGISPVIIDNTNTEIWEMEIYIKFGVQNGYLIEVLEPSTPWAKKKSELFKRNIHHVPLLSIQKMLERFEHVYSGEDLRIKFGYNYSPDMTPPVKRLIPPIPINDLNIPTPFENFEDKCKVDVMNEQRAMALVSPSSEFVSDKIENSEKLLIDLSSSENGIEKDISTINQYVEIQKSIAEFERLENEWEHGENWEECPSSSHDDTVVDNPMIDAKPQRMQKVIKPSTYENLLSSVQGVEDWSKISMLSPSWCDKNPLPRHEEPPVVEKISTYTCIESGDTNIYGLKNPLKIITAIPRDINEFHMRFRAEKIPLMRMLDKSTTTSDQMSTCRCENEEKHFILFRRLFKHVPASNLRDIFDKCHGDVNWAVDLVLDSMTSTNLPGTELIDLSDSEVEDENNELQCNCIASYGIIPYHKDTEQATVQDDLMSLESPSVKIKKCKKENIVSEESIQLKRQIEQNVIISDSHYSQHCLKLRKIRRGEIENNEINECDDTAKTVNASNVTHDVPYAENDIAPGPSRQLDTTSSRTRRTITESSDDDSNASLEESEKFVSIELGNEFIAQLDQIFGRTPSHDSANISSKINMPMSLLNEINALWIQSLSYKMEENAKQIEIMMEQDEEFARQLAMKEAELLAEGREQDVPEFKEIMDMDFALNLYHKDVAEWRNNEPNDLAAKLSRVKLYNLFPEINSATLSELLMAYDNNFQATVEVLLMSTGRTDILEAPNGINKYIMKKEMERQEKLLQEEKKALSEVDWPLLPAGEHVDMTVVEQYRNQADKHLATRNMFYQKAQDYMGRGMTLVATYYSDVAVYHKQMYEQANSRAAASLIKVHANNSQDNATIDLHFLRVGEAQETVDIFLDTHIQQLRETIERTGIKSRSLFFITGRGLHSNGKPRLKPAIKQRLKKRGIVYFERNPGLLCATIHVSDKLSYQIQ